MPPAIRRYWPAVVIAIAIIAVYFPVVGFQFTNWDDKSNIIDDVAVPTPEIGSLVQIWTQPRMRLWVPVTFSTWWFLSLVSGGPNAHVDHAMSLLLHVAASILVWNILA